MRTLLSIILAILGALLVSLLMVSADNLFGQTTGAIMPNIYPVFNNVNGITPVANGFVCTTGSGGNSSLATYQDSALMSANQNPIRLNQSGRAVNGSTLVPIYLQATQYRITVYAAGTGNTCNSVTVGSLLYQQDHVSDWDFLLSLNNVWTGTNTFTGGVFITSGASTTALYSSINNTQYCFTGTDFTAQFNAAKALLPSTGGTIDCSNLQGAQTISGLITLDKPIRLLLGSATFTTSIQPAIKIVAAGAGSRIQGNGTSVLHTTLTDTSTLLYVYETSNVKISGLQFVGGGSSDPALPSLAIDLDQDIDVEVFSNNFKDFNYSIRSIFDPFLPGSQNPLRNDIHDNVFQNGYGDNNGGYGVIIVRSRNSSIHDNIFSPGPFGRHAIYISAGNQNLNVSNNVINNTRLGSIVHNSGTAHLDIDGPQFGINVIGNIVNGPGVLTTFSHGITVTGGWQSSSITGNMIFNAGDTGIQITAAMSTASVNDSIISNNLIVNPQGSGIACFDCTRLNIGNNVILGANQSNGGGTGGAGILLDPANTSNANQNFVHGNTIHGALSPYGVDIRSGSNNNFIADNDLKGNVAATNNAGTGNLFGPNRTDSANLQVVAPIDFTGAAHFIGGNAAGFNVDNGGQQYTEIDVSNNGTIKGQLYWDNTNSLFVLNLGSGAFEVTPSAGMVIGAPTGAGEGAGTLNLTGPIYMNGTSGLAGGAGVFSCGGGQAIKTLTVSGGIVTAATCGAP